VNDILTASSMQRTQPSVTIKFIFLSPVIHSQKDVSVQSQLCKTTKWENWFATTS